MKWNVIFAVLISYFLIKPSFAQKFIFEITPGLKFAGCSFQKSNEVITTGGINTYNFERVKRVSSFENIRYTNRLGLEPELNISFLEYNSKWKMSVGLTTFIVKSRLNANTYGYTYLSNVDTSIIYTEYVSKQLITQYKQFSVNITRTILTRTKIDNLLQQKLTLGFAVNQPSIFNPRNQTEYYKSSLYNNFGYEQVVGYKKSSFWGLTYPALIFKYELELRNRKKQNGILSLYFSYVHGFSKHYTYNLKSKSIGGASIDVSAENNGSGLRIGITKSFKFEKKKV